jgi:hypothetical protein
MPVLKKISILRVKEAPMQKYLIISVVILALLFPTAASAKGYFSVGGGAGGDGGAPNITFEVENVTADRDRDRLLAVGFGFIFSADDIPSEIYEDPAADESFTRIGHKQKGNEIVILGKYGREVIKKRKLFVFAIGGFSFLEEIELYRSDVTGWYYEKSSNTKYLGVLGGGISCFPFNGKISLSIEYDNRRGLSGMIGFRF